MPDRAGASEMLRLGPGPADLARLHPWLAAAADAASMPQALLHSMHVALEEAVANVVMHAFPQAAPGEIAGEVAVFLVAEAGRATLVIEDDGRPFDPTAAPPRARPASPADVEPGGLGLTLLRHYCRDIGYEREGGRNRLTLGFAGAP